MFAFLPEAPHISRPHSSLVVATTIKTRSVGQTQRHRPALPAMAHCNLESARSASANHERAVRQRYPQSASTHAGADGAPSPREYNSCVLAEPFRAHSPHHTLHGAFLAVP